MTQFFTNLSIGHRLYAGFGLILLLTVAMAMMSGLETAHLSKNFSAYGNMASDALLVSELDGDMSDLRLGVNCYLRSNEEADLTLANEAQEQVRHGIEAAHTIRNGRVG